jgi:nicotinamidase-related amidase
VHSAFHGDVDLDAWLRERGIDAIAVCGIQTNYCCETTARIGSDLGYDVWFVLDATHTFDLAGPDGEVVPAAEIARMTGINLQDAFAEVVTTAAACA